MDNKTLASVVKEAREKLGISQREISRRTGIDNNTLAKIEKGERKKPNVLILKKLSYILHLDLEKLMKLSGYNEQDIEVSLNQSSNGITILGQNDRIIMLEDLIISSEKELTNLQILKELMDKINYDEIDLLKEMSTNKRKNAIKNFKNYIKSNEENIKNTKSSIKKTNEILNRKEEK